MSWESDNEAIEFLESRGFRLDADSWTWRKPGVRYGEMDPREEGAINYLIEEWDYGGFIEE